MPDESAPRDTAVIAEVRPARCAPTPGRLPDWVFSVVVHLLLVLVLVCSEGGSGNGGNGRGSGSGNGIGDGWIEAQLIGAGDSGSSGHSALFETAVETPEAPEPAPDEQPTAEAIAERSLSAATVAPELVAAPIPPPDDTAAAAAQQRTDAAVVRASRLVPSASSSDQDGIRQVSTGSGDSPGADGGDGGSGSAEPGGGRGRGTSLFGIWDSGQRIVYVIDRSSSMAQEEKLSAARAELERSIQRLTSRCEFQVLFYNQEVRALEAGGSSGWIRATHRNKNLVRAQVRLILAEGATVHDTALKAALQLQPDVVYFLTDAESPGIAPEVVAAISHRLRGRTRIHCIQFGEEPAATTSWLQELSAITGGRYRHIAGGALRRSAVGGE